MSYLMRSGILSDVFAYQIFRAKAMMEALMDELSEEEEEGDECEGGTRGGAEGERGQMCILCKERGGSPMGLLSLVQPSTIGQHTYWQTYAQCFPAAEEEVSVPFTRLLLPMNHLICCVFFLRVALSCGG